MSDKKKRQTLSEEQIKHLNNQLHFQSALIMRLTHHGVNAGVIPEEELQMAENFLDWYCDTFKYVISDGKFESQTD